jgi:hypothetical protein
LQFVIKGFYLFIYLFHQKWVCFLFHPEPGSGLSEYRMVRKK